jgi:hypothetical protein
MFGYISFSIAILVELVETQCVSLKGVQRTNYPSFKMLKDGLLRMPLSVNVFVTLVTQ